MKHLAAYLFAGLFVLAGIGLLAGGLWPITHGLAPTVTLVFLGLGAFVLAAGLGAASDLGLALNAAAPILNRVPMPQGARATIAQRVSTSVQAIPDDK